MNSRQRRKQKRKIKRLQEKLIPCYRDFYKDFPATIMIDIEELDKEIKRQVGFVIDFKTGKEKQLWAISDID